MDTEALRWFQQVADGATVTEVAELSMVSQPKVSRGLAALQAEVGTPLLARSGRLLRLTHAGAIFKRHVDGIVHGIDDALADVDQLVDPERGTVTLGYDATLGTWLVPSLVGTFRERHPRVRFALVGVDDEGDVFADGRVDLVVAARPGYAAGGPQVHWRRLFHEALFLAVPPGHRLEDIDTVSVADLVHDQWVALPAKAGLRHTVEELCAAAGFEPRIAFEADDLATVRGFVGAGLGVALVPAMGEDPMPRSAGVARLVAVADPGARRDIGLAWSAQRRLLPAAELFRRHVLATVSR